MKKNEPKGLGLLGSRWEYPLGISGHKGQVRMGGEKKQLKLSKFHEMHGPNHPSSTPNRLTIKILSTHTHKDFIERPKENWD